MLDLDAVETALASPKPKRRMRWMLPAMIAELRAARAVITAIIDDGWYCDDPMCPVCGAVRDALTAYHAAAETEAADA